MMKRIFLFLFLCAGYCVSPVFTYAQGSQEIKAKQKTKAGSKSKNKETNINAGTKFTINGTVTGYPDGTVVEFLNGQSGATEMSSEVKAGKFSFTGKMERPEFKIILFNKQQPFITLFLDNSNVKITGDKAAIDKAKIEGSPAHKAFDNFNTSLDPYKAVFENNAPYDSALVSNAMQMIKKFVKGNTGSAITPLAVIRFNQIADDILKTEELYNLLDPQIKASAMGLYIAQLISESKVNGAGSVLADFTQADTSGVPVSLSSLRGHYVLVDFWASWCGPCRQENPNLVAAYNKYKNKNFTVLGVSLDKAKPAWIDAINMDGLTWTHVSDLQGWSNAVAQKFQIFSIPQNFLLDPQGKVIGKNLRGEALDRKLAKLLR